MNFQFNIDKTEKQNVLDQTLSNIHKLNLNTSYEDRYRPWGGFFYIDLSNVERFIDLFFTETNKDEIFKYGKNLQPKILAVEPGQKLSWQYHKRRAEIWKIVKGPVGIMTSHDNQKPEAHKVLDSGDYIALQPGTRHRLIGLESWCIFAEIWQHTDPDHLSDEDDIIRIEDNYGRN